MLKGSVHGLGRPGGLKFNNTSVAADCRRCHSLWPHVFYTADTSIEKKSRHSHALVSTLCEARAQNLWESLQNEHFWMQRGVLVKWWRGLKMGFSRPGEDVSGCLRLPFDDEGLLGLLRELFFQELAFLKIRGIYSS